MITINFILCQNPKKILFKQKNQIDKFIKELRTSDFEKYEILIWLRNIVWDTFPKVNETFKYGGIVFSLKENFGGLFVFKKNMFLLNFPTVIN